MGTSGGLASGEETKEVHCPESDEELSKLPAEKQTECLMRYARENQNTAAQNDCIRSIDPKLEKFNNYIKEHNGYPDKKMLYKECFESN